MTGKIHTEMHEKALLIEKLTFGYEKERDILKGISFAAEKGESVGLVGANGAGKSTLLKLLVGLELHFGGSIAVEGIALSKDTLSQVRQKVGYVFQDSDSQLFMSTAYEDVAFGPRNYGLPEEEVKKRTQQALEMVDAVYLGNRQTYKMSGGEKKLISIATILSMTPDIILMDEPSVALDPKNRRNLIRLLNTFSQLKIIASHDLDMVWDTCERTILIADGNIAADGPTKEILSDEKLMLENGLELPLSLGRR